MHIYWSKMVIYFNTMEHQRDEMSPFWYMYVGRLACTDSDMKSHVLFLYPKSLNILFA